MGSPIARGKNTWRLHADGPPDPVTGKRNQRTRTFHGTKTEAKYAQASFELEVRGIQSATSLTFSQLLDVYLPACRSWIEQQTYDNYSSTCRLYLRPHLGHLPLCDLRPHHLNAMYAALALPGGGTKVRSLAPTTIKRVHQVALAVLAYAERNEWVPRNVASLAQPPKARRRKPQTPDTAGVELLLNYLRTYDHDLYVYVELLACLGARPGEVCGLKWGDVNWSDGTVFIERSIQRDRVAKSTKMDKERTVSLDDFTLSLLKTYRPADAEPEHYIFTRTRGRYPWAPNIPSMSLKHARAASGAGEITARSLRHYVATRLISNGVDVRTVAGRLGNTPAVLLNVYADFIPGNDRAAADLLRGLRSGEQG